MTTLTSRNNVISTGHLPVMLEAPSPTWLNGTITKASSTNQFSY